MFIKLFDLNGHGFFIAAAIFIFVFCFSAYCILNKLIIKNSMQKGIN